MFIDLEEILFENIIRLDMSISTIVGLLIAFISV